MKKAIIVINSTWGSSYRVRTRPPVYICFWPTGRSVLGKTVPYSRPLTQFFPIRTHLGRQITCLLFSSVGYFVRCFCAEISLQPFSNLSYACVWHLGNSSFAFYCFLCHYLHFTFFAAKRKTPGKDAKAGKLVVVRTRGFRMGKSGPLERAQLANQIQGFRVPDHSDAWENNKCPICNTQNIYRIG